MNKVQLFVDWGSQPSRAVAIFANIAKIPHEIIETRIINQAQRAPEYSKMNPTRKVPAMKDGDFVLFESHAILRYLADAKQTNQQWYPKDFKKRALVERYLDWHHTNTRKCAQVVFNTLFAPMLGLKVEVNLELAKKEAYMAIKFIDQYFLKENVFLAGDQPTIADISCYCELIQMLFLEFNFSPYSNITSWMKKMESIPEVKKGHELFNKLVQSSVKKQREAKPKL